MPPRIDTLARRYSEGRSPDEIAALNARMQEQVRRLRTIRECPTSLDLACRLTVSTVRTPALELITAELRRVVSEPAGRTVISMPPQEGKTLSLQALCLWLLIDDPNRRIVFASYSSFLARRSGREVRALVETYGRQVGLSLARDHSDASDWQIAGSRGGMVSVGVGGSLTGRPADVLVIDDALRGQKDADSAVVRGGLHDWWSTVARTRLSPGAPVVVVGTRWHQDDLSGRLIGEGWPALNIPAMADGATPDALGRPSGEWLTSARGRTVAEWLEIRRDVGERGFAALYQGRPAPLAGGVFKADWFDTWRVATLPAGCLPPVVVVDPADNEGDGDEAGIILAAVHPATGRVFIVDDLSASMTVARWARVALLTCVRRDAPTLAYEQSLSQLAKRIREAWQVLHQQAVALHRSKGDRAAALARLARADDTADTTAAVDAQLADLTTVDVAGIVAVGSTGPRLHKITAKGSKQSRMLWAAPLLETGRVVLVGRHPKLEHQATTWQPGMDSPDRVDAMVHACALATTSLSSLGRSDDRVPTRSTGRTTGSSQITRSTRR